MRPFVGCELHPQREPFKTSSSLRPGLLRPNILGAPTTKFRKRPVCDANSQEWRRVGCLRRNVRRPLSISSPTARRARNARRGTVAVQASSFPEWHHRATALAEGLLSRLRDLCALAAHTWRQRAYFLQTWYSKTAAICMLALLAITSLANLWGVPSLNAHLLPQITLTASEVLEREVDLGRVRWIAPTGLLGLTPIASVGPVSLGASAVEKSSAVLPEVSVRLDLVKSLLQQKLMLQLQAENPEVGLVQNDNFSWFGYPDDTLPSCRSFLPGLHKLQKSGEREVAPKPKLEVAEEEAQGLAIERADRKKQFPVPPEAAANFRPAVGKELVEQATKQARAQKSKKSGVKPSLDRSAPAAAGFQRFSKGSHELLQSSAALGKDSEEQAVEGAEWQKLSDQGSARVKAPGKEESASETLPNPSEETPEGAEPVSAAAPAADAEKQGLSLQRSENEEHLPQNIVDRAEKPIELGGDSLFEGNSLQGSTDPNPTPETGRLGMVEPTMNALNRLAGPDARIGEELLEPLLDEGLPSSGPNLEASAGLLMPSFTSMPGAADVLKASAKPDRSRTFGDYETASADSTPQLLKTAAMLAPEPSARDKQGRPDGQAPALLAAGALEAEAGGRGSDDHADSLIPDSPASFERSFWMELDVPTSLLLNNRRPAGPAASTESNLWPAESADESAIEDRIRQSREASTSGRDEEGPFPRHYMLDRVRTQGGFREGAFGRPAVRRTARSWLRRHLPLDQQLQDQPRLAGRQPVKERVSEVPVDVFAEKLKFTMAAAEDGAPSVFASGVKLDNMHAAPAKKPGLSQSSDNLPFDGASAWEWQFAPWQDSAASAASLLAQIPARQSDGAGEETQSAPAESANTQEGELLSRQSQEAPDQEQSIRQPGLKRKSRNSKRRRLDGREKEKPKIQISAREIQDLQQPEIQTATLAPNLRWTAQRPLVSRTTHLPSLQAREGGPSAWLKSRSLQLQKLGAAVIEKGQHGIRELSQKYARLAAPSAEENRGDSKQQGSSTAPQWRMRSYPKLPWPPRLRISDQSFSNDTPQPVQENEMEGEPLGNASEIRAQPGAHDDAGPPRFRWDRLQDAGRLIRARRDSLTRNLDRSQPVLSSATSSQGMKFFFEDSSASLLGAAMAQPKIAAPYPAGAVLASAARQEACFGSCAFPQTLQQPQEAPKPAGDRRRRKAVGAKSTTSSKKREAVKQEQQAPSSEAVEEELQQGPEQEVIIALSAPSTAGQESLVGSIHYEPKSGDSKETEQQEEVAQSPAGVQDSLAAAPPPKTEPRVTRTSAEPRLSKPKQRAHGSKRPQPEEDTGPRYTPGAPMLAGPRRGIGGWLARQIQPLLSDIKLPDVGVESVRIRGGELRATLVGEPLPRLISDVDLTLRLSSDYRNISLDLAGNAHERDSASNRITMSAADPVRHLRGTPSFPITQKATDAPIALQIDGGLEKAEVAFTTGNAMGELRRGLEGVKSDAERKFEEIANLDYELSEKDVAETQKLKPFWRRWRSGNNKATGGQIRARVVSKGLHLKYPDTRVQLWGKNLHAPMAERVLELPIDVHDGRFNGELRMYAFDAETWRLPLFGGRLRCSGLAFHFWDVTDDFTGADMDLVFEGRRLYLHNARGRFGAVPMTITGDMDLDPLTGQYRFTCSVAEVEVNELRKTLGIRPPPLPVGGALRGVLHCTGPLEQPVFSGTAVALPPSPEAVAGMEACNAKGVLIEEPAAAGAYDKIPFASASAIFTMDTSNDIFLLHSLQAEPLDGGSLIGSGRLWVNPIAEHDTGAVKVDMKGKGLPFEPLLLRYMPKGTHLPPSLVLGEGNIQGSMAGSHVAPNISAKWDLPAASASGTADFSPKTTAVTCKAPAIDVSGALHVVPPDPQAVKKATTQAEVSALAVPVLDGLDLDANFKGLDVLPIVSPPEALEHIHSSQPLRLKLNGRVKFSGGMDRSEKKSSFAGDLSLDNLRVNQLKLTRNLSGNLSVAEDSFQIHAKGSRPDEALDVTLKLPLLDPERAEDAARASSGQPKPDARSGPFGIKLADLLPIPGFESVAPGGQPEPPPDGGGHFSLRCGQLLMSAEVNGKASLVDCQIQGLKLDELELASLRGEVQEASLRLDLEARQGRGQVSVQGPRFSGLQGESLSTAVRWERDVVRLERANLQQKNSRYEVQGEYVIPASVAIPRSAASMALPPRDPEASAQNWSPFESSTGRWRVQVNVPTAQMEEILPAARLLSRATSPTASDYERAKSAFLMGVQEAAVQAQDLGRQLEAAAESLRAELASALASDEEVGSSGRSSKSGVRPTLPGLQDLKGQWNGTFQAYGGGGGAANVDFNMRGQEWQWGDYSLDQAVAQGACHSLEGVKIEEVSLRAGDAKLLVRGKLLTADQNASVLLTDFPVALLQPLFRSMPALQHAPPAAGSGVSGGSGNSGFSGLTMPFTNRSGEKADGSTRPISASSFANSPVNGLLYVRGIIGGSATVPEGELMVRLFDGAIGPTQLAQAQATASLDADQRLKFGMDFAPAEPRTGGFARVTGSVPLRPSESSRGILAAEDSDAAMSNDLEVSVHVKDGGMKLVRILTPDFRWQSGNADIRLKLHGRPGDVGLDGGMQISKATVTSPFLKYPMTNMAAHVGLADNIVRVESVEAKVGRRGFVRVKGGLPIARQQGKSQASAEGQRGKSRWNAISIDIHDLELRLRSIYMGNVDASLKVRNSLVQPILGGDVRLSRGTALLVPQGSPLDPEDAAAAPEDDLVQKAFTALTRKDGIAKQLAKPQEGDPQGMPNLQLQGLQVQLGPELRAMYPVVVNLGISGGLELNGLAHPKKLRLAGVVNLESGEINLVAAQMVLDREHRNRLVFEGQEGLDPVVDLSLRGAQIRALIQGRASTWHRHLVLTPITAAAGEAAEQLQPSEAARIFEGQLASALVAEDGQLALSNLAVSAAHGFMPKIQTQGQLGQARWRLVSAPSIPGLLSLDPTGDPTSLLSSLTMGTEVEVQFGNSLQAAMARKLRESDIATQWTLTYKLNSKLRMQFTIASIHPYPRTLLFQYSGDSS